MSNGEHHWHYDTELAESFPPALRGQPWGSRFRPLLLDQTGWRRRRWPGAARAVAATGDAHLQAGAGGDTEADRAAAAGVAGSRPRRRGVAEVATLRQSVAGTASSRRRPHENDVVYKRLRLRVGCFFDFFCGGRISSRNSPASTLSSSESSIFWSWRAKSRSKETTCCLTDGWFSPLDVMRASVRI